MTYNIQSEAVSFGIMTKKDWVKAAEEGAKLRLLAQEKRKKFLADHPESYLNKMI
jgi:hypothetical protein